MRRSVLLVMLLLGACAQVVPGTPAANGISYVVYFQEWSAGLDSPARKAIAAAAVNAKAHPGVPILVSGYAANDTGSTLANRALSRTRALVVANELVANGIAAARIREVAEGAVSYDLDPLEVRRVTISVGQS